MPPAFAAQPLFAPLEPLLERLQHDGALLEVEPLNALAAERGIVTGSGAQLRFVVPGASGLSYEERIYWLGEVETRPGNWHDGFNALVWLSYPRTKAALNACHHQALAQQQASGNAGRGPLRDALTQFDECGVAVVSSRLDLWQEIRNQHWKEVFWEKRADVQRSLRVFVFGHASFDILRTPRLGLCGKALFLHVDENWLELPAIEQLAAVDARMAQRFTGDVTSYAKPRDFRPLPLMGIPGVTPDNEYPAYYDDQRQFRPLRALPSLPTLHLVVNQPCT
ncbi:MAG: DUF3025 domain-containing protein [Betaproteobacteria bacterium]|nr:DUF3025 domain-containing protein [Betaproteobacteria bacterium]